MSNSPKKVEDHVQTILEALRETNFFIDFEIEEDYALKHFTELITEKYIENPSMDYDFFWTEEEFQVILNKIITGSIMYEMKESGILESYEDENTEEVFFLTEKGKKLSEELKRKEQK